VQQMLKQNIMRKNSMSMENTPTQSSAKKKSAVLTKTAKIEWTSI
jgi:hypothetical protein